MGSVMGPIYFGSCLLSKCEIYLLESGTAVIFNRWSSWYSTSDMVYSMDVMQNQ
jgi:hypothetical protein